MKNATLEKPASKPASRGLGKGLSALMSESYSTSMDSTASAPNTEATSSGPEEIALKSIKPGKFQPREHFDSAALNELSDSIKRNGVMQPILLRQLKDGYEIIAGERRFRAAKQAGLKTIPALVREYDDKQSLELALVENLQREDLNVIEEAAGYRRLMDEFKYTQEALSNVVHKSRSHIANFLRLLALPKELHQMLAENKISMGHAKIIASAPNTLELAHTIIKKGLSVRQTEELMRGGAPAAPRAPRQKHAQTGAAPLRVGPKDPDIMALEDTLSENLGLKVSINDRGQSGEIVIAYDTLEQLDEILRRLGGGA